MSPPPLPSPLGRVVSRRVVRDVRMLLGIDENGGHSLKKGRRGGRQANWGSKLQS